MGMTDPQFKAFLRLLISLISEIENEPDPTKQTNRLKSLIKLLQTSLED